MLWTAPPPARERHWRGCNYDRFASSNLLRVRAAACGPSVWTGRALQAEND